MPSNALYRGYKKADEYVTNALIGAGYGIQNQLEGLYQMAAHPVNTLQGIGAMVTHPKEAGQAMWQGVKDYGTMATSGPLGLGQVIGDNMPLTMKRAPSKLDMTVYHGSPHNFDAFDISKIGTGEGAQAYGHGLYVAENPRVAGGYAVKLADALSPQQATNDLIYQMSQNSPASHTLENVRWYMKQDRAIAQYADDPEVVSNVLAALKGRSQSGTVSSQSLKNYDWLDKRFGQQKGIVYHVDLPDEHIAKMLDWDKPLSEQPESVRRAFPEWARTATDPSGPRPDITPTLTGGEVYRKLAAKIGSDKASSVLNDAGIPGIRYLDRSSRAAGDGTRNYVVFDDKLLKILKKE